MVEQLIFCYRDRTVFWSLFLELDTSFYCFSLSGVEWFVGFRVFGLKVLASW